MSELPSDSNKAPVPVDVTMGGRHYRLRGSDPEQLRRLAAEVDATLSEVAGARGASDDYKVAVLAALNLAADRDEHSRRLADQVEQLRARARRLEARLVDISSRLQDASAGSV